MNDAASFAAAASADWVGLVFYPASPRAVTPSHAATIVASQPGGPARVGLFVEPADEEIEAALAAVSLEILQVYAAPERVSALRERFGLPVWRGVGVETASDLPQDDRADGFVLDAKPPPNADLPGGNAVCFDWSLLRSWRAPRPWLLAGGLTVDNVGEAITVSGAQAVDVSSGVESRRGVKDPALIADFIAAVRRADQGGRMLLRAG